MTFKKKTVWRATCLLALTLAAQSVTGQQALDMAGAAAEAEGWKLQFSDDFNRTELGENWRSAHGNWTIKNRMLDHPDEKGHIVTNWRFTGDVRLEYDAVTDSANPCDLSGVLNASFGQESSGYYFGFGGQSNTVSFLIARQEIVDRADVLIVPGKRYHVICQREGKNITFTVDGKVIISHVHDKPIDKPGFDRVGLSVYSSGRFDNVQIYTKNDGQGIPLEKTERKAEFYEVTGFEVEDPLFETLFSDRPTPGIFLPYGLKYDGRKNDRGANSPPKLRFAGKRFGKRYVLGEALDEAAAYNIPCYGHRDETAYKKRGILTYGEAVDVPRGRSLISLPDRDLPPVYNSGGWILDPRYLKELSRQVGERARKNEHDFVRHFDEIWTAYANRPVPRDKWYKEIEEADKIIRRDYGFGKYGMPASYADGDPFDRIAYARWAWDRLTESFVNGYEAAKKINPDMQIMGPTHGSTATSGDIEAWSKGFDIYGGQTVGGQTNTLFDWVRPGGTTKLYVDLSDKPIWMMMHMAKRQMPVRDPEYIREVYSQIFRNGGESLHLMNSAFFEAELADVMYTEPFKWNAMLELSKVIRTMRLPKMPETADTAILYSSITTVTDQWGGLSGDNDRHLTAYAALGPCLGNWFHFVSDRQVVRDTRDLGDYKSIVVPWVTYEYPEVLDKFKTYTRDGGVLIVTDADAFTWNINGEKFGTAWEELSGVRRIEPRKDEAIMTVKASEHLDLPDGFALSALVPGHRVEVVNDTVVTIATFPDGTPAITMHPYGKGKVYYFAADPLFAVYEHPQKRSTVAQGSPVVQFLGAIQESAGVKTGHDIWRFKLPPYKTDIYRKESGFCLTNNYVYDVNEPLLEPNNRDLKGTYSYSRAPDAMADVAAANVPFKTGHLTNRLAAFETRDKYKRSTLAHIEAETPKWVVAWKDPAPIGITFDLKSDQPLIQCRLVFSGTMPSLTVSGSKDGTKWLRLASTAGEVAGIDVKTVRLYLNDADRSGKGKNVDSARDGLYRYLRFDFTARKAPAAFELCEVDIWGN